jgi:tryptophan-rich sensory protein
MTVRDNHFLFIKNKMNVYWHVFTPIVAALLVNGVIFGLKWNQEQDPTKEKNPLIPPGIFIAFIWTTIFAILGFLHYKLYNTRHSSRWAVVTLIVFCIMYPFLTAGLKTNTVAAVLNLTTLLFAFVVALLIPNTLVVYMIPIIVWASYVNLAQVIYPRI